MATRKPVALGDLFNRSSSKLADLTRLGQEREALADSLRGAFPNDIKPHLVSAEIKNDRLILVADHAVWAARMRFYTSDALKVMAAIHNSSLKRVEVRVRPQPQDPAQTGPYG
ncbi:MAG: DciA family protein [Gammaproteobacteria bacterium]